MDNLKDRKENQILKNIIIASVSILTVLLLIIIWNAIAPFQSDNDNIYLRTIVSGEMTGHYESHLYYMGIISGVILSALYTITGNVIPWFGIFLCASMASTMCALLYVSLKKCKKIYSIIILYVFHVIIFISFFYHYFAKTQFTIATGMVGVTALFCLAVVKFEEKLSKSIIACIPFLIFSIWSLGMRDKGFFMLIPFFGMVFLGKLIDAKEKKAKLNVVITGLIFLAVIGSVFGINKLAYSSDEWKEFKAYTDASEELFDYYGFPDYDENEKEYEKYGITKSSYEAAVYHYNIILDSAINKDSMVSLAEVAKENREKNSEALPLRLIGILKEIVYRNIKDYQDRPINIAVFALYAFVFVLALFKKKFRALKDLGFIVVARMFDWIYLVWYGRYPFRVTQIVYLAELVLLVAIIINHELWARKSAATDSDVKEEKDIKEEKGFNKILKDINKTVKVNPVYILMIALIIFAGFRFGIPVMKSAKDQIKAFRKMSVCFTELEDYLEAHPDNFYFFDMSHLYYTEDTLRFKKAEYENYVYMGSWMPLSPWYNHKLESYGITDPDNDLLNKDNVYILYQTVDFDTREFLDKYFADHEALSSIEVIDTFTSSNGFNYEILKPIDNNNLTTE